MSKLYLVTPVYNDRQSLTELIRQLHDIHHNHGPLHAVVVDDGSLREPVEAEAFEDCPFDVEVITLRRNVGHQRAIAIGLSHLVKQQIEGNILVMDGDGEDRPQDIPQLIEQISTGSVDVVVAERRKREESPWFKGFYRVYKGLFRLLTGHVIRFGNFCILTPRAARRLVHMDELWMHFPATIIKSGLSIRNHAVDRGKRYFGSSRMNLVSLITHGLRSVATFTESVLTRIILFCALIAGTSITLIVIASAIKLLGYATPGWFTTAVGVLLGLLIQTATITLISLLLAMSSRSAAAIIPLKLAFEFIDEVKHIPASRGD